MSRGMWSRGGKRYRYSSASTVQRKDSWISRGEVSAGKPPLNSSSRLVMTRSPEDPCAMMRMSRPSSRANSWIYWRHAPHGRSGTWRSDTTATARKLRSPWISAWLIALRSAQAPNKGMRDSVLHPSKILPLFVRTAAPTRKRLNGTDAFCFTAEATAKSFSTSHLSRIGPSDAGEEVRSIEAGISLPAQPVKRLNEAAAMPCGYAEVPPNI
jgi:hypothetical protein